MTILIFILMLTIPALAPSAQVGYMVQNEAIMPYEKLWQAVCAVESSNNPLAYNSKAKELFGEFANLNFK